MTEPFARLRRLLGELKRRKVYRAAAGYLVAAFVVLQLASLAADAFGFPGWFEPMVWVVAGLGFPIVLVLAWAFEMTPEGVRRTRESEETTAEPSASGVGGLMAGLVILLLAGGGLWYLTAGGGKEPAEKTAAATDTAQASGAPGGSAASRDRPFVAVLPLENLSPDEENAFFADGIHEEILGQLSKVSGLGVFARTTMTQYEDTEKSVYEIGRELNARAVLEGSVRRSAGRVRISAQLIDPESRDHLWSETYERAVSPDVVFDIQAEIAEQIAGSLEAQLAGEERRRIENAPTDDLAAYEAFLRGRGQVWQVRGQGTPELLDRASRNLREAVDRDSSFAEAHAWLAQAHLARISHATPGEAPRWLDSASAAVERARRIDPDRAAIHVAQAGIYRRQDSLQAETEALRRALALQPNHALATAELARNLARQRGKLAEAVRTAREAVRLDPRHPQVLRSMGVGLEVVGLHDAAEAWYRHTLEIEPGNLWVHAGLASNELVRGRPERALAFWQDYFEQTDAPSSLSYLFAAWAALGADRPEQAHDYLRRHLSREYAIEGAQVSVGWPARHPEKSRTVTPGAGVTLGFTELRLGQEEEGRRILREAVEALRGNTERGERLGRPYRILFAGALAALGQTEEALQEVERAAQEERGMVWLKGYPMLAPLRSEPRFQEVVRQVEAHREEAREEIRRMGIDLYPPGAERDSLREARPDSE